MTKRSPDEFLRDVEARQRNIVFPDTASNEARFWRNVISGKTRLSTVQVVGIVLVCGILAEWIRDILKVRTSIFTWLFLGGCGAVFLLLRWRIRKALASAHKRPPLAK